MPSKEKTKHLHLIPVLGLKDEKRILADDFEVFHTDGSYNEDSSDDLCDQDSTHL